MADDGAGGRRIASVWRWGGEPGEGDVERLEDLLSPLRASVWPDAERVHCFHLCPDGKVQWANYLLIQSPAEVYGRRLELWLEPLAREAYLGALARARSTLVPQRWETDGDVTRKPWACCITPMVLEGRLIGFAVESRQIACSPSHTGVTRINANH